MRKGYYLFVECGRLSNQLTACSVISFVLSVVFLLLYAPDPHRWYAGFILPHVRFCILLGLVLAIANICVHKICEDVAALLKASREEQK